MRIPKSIGAVIPLLACLSSSILISAFSTPSPSTSAPTSTSTSSALAESMTISKIPIYVGGFFPIEGHWAHELLPRTVQTAIDHVNELPGILDDYELRMRWNWTMGSPANALRLLHDFVSSGPPVLMTWGPMFSSVATVVNEIAPEYNIVQVVTAGSSTLNDRTRYPLTVRISGDEDLLNPARTAFIKAMGWTRVAIIFEDTDYFRERHDARVIFAGFLPDQALIVFCKIFQQGLYGSKFVWIIPGWFESGWWRNPDPEIVPCTSEEMEMMLQYHIGFDGDQFVSDVEEISFNGVKPLPHHLEYLRALHEMDDNSRDIYAYDNLITMALILNSSIADVEQLPGYSDGDKLRPTRLDDFTYSDTDMDKVEIEREGIRNSPVNVEQFIGSTVFRILNYSDKNGTLHSVENRSIRWADGKRPVDGITYQPIDETVSSTVRIIFYSLSGVGIVLSLIFFSLNVHYREYRTIKISSPTLNNLIVFGCLMLYAAIIIPGLDKSSYSEPKIVVLCHVQTGLISVGISLSLGALFGKTYRIHAIFKKAVERLQKINLPDSKLILGVFALVFADISIIMFRVVLDDVHVTSHCLDAQLDMTDPRQEIYFEPTVRMCESTNQIFFLIIMFGIKGILVMFGIFLAWETRDVAVSDLNDSKYIAFSVYTVAVTLAVAVPTSYLFMYQVDRRFIIFSCAVLFANTTVLCLVFVPKIRPLCSCTLGNRDMMKKTETSSARPKSSSHSFHFHSADDGVKKLMEELVKVIDGNVK
ncbi:gamma-aminobutyric acid type B receptor subunit 2-like [Strongylocentrotus purpuratus]|uniref:G-protein coupled receptors family 3 profile domain-containing protein n=1 Tax=Strongylocentrotus purpuratus TaxID=7668 RepID=A0A7M7PMS1_STRPU|nr:gamma-aminobutyric acid type B receptor subunit 2-like [Strongylocentrotus purpuratus]